jgi:regulator of RNase E activity RraB
MKIPNDADGDAMRNVLSHGSDPSRPMDIDFMIACPDVAAAERIAPLASSRGFTTKISVDEEDDSVTCYCMRHMLLDYDALISTQAELDALAKPHEGYIDGWGTFGNASEAKP